MAAEAVSARIAAPSPTSFLRTPSLVTSRLDENDAIFVLDNAFIPWEDVFVCHDVERANN
jgi:hypothetical protein